MPVSHIRVVLSAEMSGVLVGVLSVLLGFEAVQQLRDSAAAKSAIEIFVDFVVFLFFIFFKLFKLPPPYIKYGFVAILLQGVGEFVIVHNLKLPLSYDMPNIQRF